MTVELYDFNKLHDKKFQEKILLRFKNIISKNSYIEGEYNFSFEERFAQMQDAKYCSLVANGTDAIEIALKVLKIKSGDYVGVPGITFYATAEAVLNVGATPILIDVNEETGLICLDSLKRLSEKNKIKAIIPVHIYGLPCDIESINEFCLENNICVIEDAAQAQGGYYENKKPIGSSGNLVTFSFYPTKNLSAFGDAGAILCNDVESRDKILPLRNHGRSPEGILCIGRNSRCDHMQAAVLDLKLETIEQLNNQRKKIAKLYYKHLAGLPLKLIPEKYIPLSSWHQFPVSVESKEVKISLMEFLKESGVASGLYYEKSIGEEIPLSSFSGEKEKSINFAAKTFCLAIHPYIVEENIIKTADAVRNFFTKRAYI